MLLRSAACAAILLALALPSAELALGRRRGITSRHADGGNAFGGLRDCGSGCTLRDGLRFEAAEIATHESRRYLQEGAAPHGGEVRDRDVINSAVAEGDQPLDCSELREIDRFVMVASKDTSWLEDMNISHVGYQYHDASLPHFFNNTANEAGAYLQFIIDYYECLPKAVAFIHGHKSHSWHSADMGEILNKLKWSSLEGYADINGKPGLWTIPVGTLGAHPDAEPVATGADAYNGKFSPYQVIRGAAYPYWESFLYLQQVATVRAYDMFFGAAGLGEMPPSISYTCCSQFVVPREKITLRPRSFYQAAVNYLADNDLRGNHHVSKKYVLGDVLTTYWAMIFGEPALQVPREQYLRSSE